MQRKFCYLSIILLTCQPTVEEELKLLIGLDVPDQDSTAVPGGVIVPASVVMPDAEISKVAQRSTKHDCVSIQ